MGTQISGKRLRKSGSRSSVPAVAALLALWLAAAAHAVPFLDLAADGSLSAGAPESRPVERAPWNDPVSGPALGRIEFGPAGFTVMGPLSFAYGEPGGIVLCWEFDVRDPAYLVASTSLLPSGTVDGRAGRRRLAAMLRSLPNLGVVPRADLAVFDTGAVDPIFWDSLEFDCGILVLRVDQYLALRRSMVGDEIEGGLASDWIRPNVSAAPEPSPALLIGQGVIALALRRSRRLRARRATCGDG